MFPLATCNRCSNSFIPVRPSFGNGEGVGNNHALSCCLQRQEMECNSLSKYQLLLRAGWIFLPEAKKNQDVHTTAQLDQTGIWIGLNTENNGQSLELQNRPHGAYRQFCFPHFSSPVAVFQHLQDPPPRFPSASKSRSAIYISKLVHECLAAKQTDYISRYNWFQLVYPR